MAAAQAGTDAIWLLPALAARPSTADQAAAALRGHIANGLLLPGDQLREEAIAATLGVSRNTVREAFRMLSHERLVEHTLHRGVFVRQMTAAEVRDIFQTRRLLEPLGIEPTAKNPAAASALLDIAVAAERQAAERDWDAVGTADIEFHRKLAQGCGSERLDRLFAGLFAELRLAFSAVGAPQALHEPYVAANRTLAELISAGHLDRAHAELETYLHTAEQQVLAALS